MKNYKKDLNELTNLLKWQINMGADAMIEEKNNLFSNKEPTFKSNQNQNSQLENLEAENERLKRELAGWHDWWKQQPAQPVQPEIDRWPGNFGFMDDE